MFPFYAFPFYPECLCLGITAKRRKRDRRGRNAQSTLVWFSITIIGPANARQTTAQPLSAVGSSGLLP